jgi:hypothetical protein
MLKQCTQTTAPDKGLGQIGENTIYWEPIVLPVIFMKQVFKNSQFSAFQGAVV